MEIREVIPVALSIIAWTIALAVGAIILTEMRVHTSEETQVLNEQYQPIQADGIQDADNVVITLAYKPVKEDTVKLYWFDASTASEILLTKETNYTVLQWDPAKLDVFSVPQYNSTDGDRLEADYIYYKETKPAGVVERGLDALGTYGDWVGLIVIVILTAVVITITRRYFRPLGA